MHLSEKLDFSFSIKDFKEISSMFDQYMDDRVSLYKKIFLEQSPTKQQMLEYISFFITPVVENALEHPNLYRIKHFISRNYEFYTLPSVSVLIEDLYNYLNLSAEDINLIEDFSEFEYNVIQTLYDSWRQLYEKVQELPFLLLKTFKYTTMCNCQIYYDPTTEEFTLKNFITFIKIIHKYFPKQLMRLDTFILCDPEYIEFSAGDKTMAFYLDDTVFIPCTVKNEDKEFYVETLYHEFAHHLFTLMKETSQLLWYDLYNTWVEKKLKFTRDDGNNEVEELFADVFSLLISPVHDFIQDCSKTIKDYFKIIIEKEFGVLL